MNRNKTRFTSHEFYLSNLSDSAVDIEIELRFNVLDAFH